MNRRHTLRWAISAAVAARAPPLWAQTAKTGPRRVGVLAPSTRAKEEVILKPFFDQMRALGWIEEQTIIYDRAFADDQQRDVARLAVELAARKPELIYAPPMPAALAAKRATDTIPIVFGTGTDPVAAGLVASMARPGGNVTGVASSFESIVPKRIELLHEMLPGAKRIGFLGDPSDARFKIDSAAIAPAARTLGLTIVMAEACNAVEFDAAVATLINQGVEAIYGGGSLVTNLRVRLVELANRKRLPVVGGNSPMPEAGALFSYGPSLDDQFRRSAQMVDKILRGAKPADMAVEQLTKFELVINLKAAKALGITAPQTMLRRADEVIQ